MDIIISGSKRFFANCFIGPNPLKNAASWLVLILTVISLGTVACQANLTTQPKAVVSEFGSGRIITVCLPKYSGYGATSATRVQFQSGSVYLDVTYPNESGAYGIPTKYLFHTFDITGIDTTKDFISLAKCD